MKPTKTTKSQAIRRITTRNHPQSSGVVAVLCRALLRALPRVLLAAGLLALATPALFTSAVAAPVLLTSRLTGGNNSTLILQGAGVGRYLVDGLTRSLTIPEGVLAEGALLPAGVSASREGDVLVLRFTNPFSAALSPDNLTLTLSPAVVSSLIQVPDDERKPIIIELRNAVPSQIAGLLGKLYPTIKVEVDERTRSLLILVNPTDRAVVLDVVRSLDIARPQVLFEAQIIEINRTLTQQLGIDYDSIFTFKLNEQRAGVGGAGGASNIFELGSFDRNALVFTFGLNLLKNNSAAKVLAQPRVTTLDGVEARINATQTTPIIVNAAGGQQSVQNITTGITLRLVPKVSSDGMIEAQISVSVSTPTSLTSQGIPSFSTREATTTVRVAGGEPIAIGGLLESRTLSGSKGIPLLSDIPLLGELFKTTTNNTVETDLVIIVTPKLIGPNGQPLSLPSLAPIQPAPPAIQPAQPAIQPAIQPAQPAPVTPPPSQP
jgi:general secretion pathway protein D